ncbi:MAG TPA: hypothetical protein PLI47_06675 [Bacteroidia bacterium]|nr:hypothetical protein [Bacteroidia bacterium]
MKSKYLIIALFAILASCTENSQDIPNPGNAPDISAVPTVFKQKILNSLAANAHEHITL